MPDNRKYFIQHRGYVGNCLLWWGPDRCGYTCDLNKAGRYTVEEVKQITGRGVRRMEHNRRKKQDIGRLVSKVLAKATVHLTSEIGL